jgi:hypothetical protein
MSHSGNRGDGVYGMGMVAAVKYCMYFVMKTLFPDKQVPRIMISRHQVIAYQPLE